MVELLIRLFKLWGSSENLSLTDERQNSLIDEWGKLCWQIQIQLFLAPVEKASYLNAIAALSDQIYKQYRRHKKLPYLRKLLEDLEHLLDEREEPTKFQISLLKAKIAEEGKVILSILRSRSISGNLISILQFAFKDINTNFRLSKKMADYLNCFAFWASHQDTLTTEQLIEHLIQINFNHPQVLEYILIAREISEYPEALEKLYQMQKTLMERQRHYEYLNLLSVGTLYAGHSSVAANLLNSIKVDLKFVHLQMQRQLAEINLKGPIPAVGLSEESTTMIKKKLAKWPSDKSDLVELAYAIYIYMRARGSQITIAMLVKWFEDAFGVTLSRYSHRFAEIKMRKSTRPSKFLDTMVNEFLNYVEDGDAFQPV